MNYQLICNKKVSDRSPFFRNVFGSNRDSYCDGFADVSSIYGTFTDAITASASIVFTGVSIIAADEKSDLRAIPPKSNRFLFKPQFRASLAEGSGRIQ
jgi:hypothetical protein